MKYLTIVAAVLVALMVIGGPAWTQEKTAKEEKLIVAVLNFETGSKEIAQYSEQIPDLLTVFLTAEPTLQLVERAKIKNILEELALGATGVVDDATKAKIGNMTGAKFIITGRAMVVGKQLYLTAKVMSTETGKVGAKMAKIGADANLDEGVQKLSEELVSYLNENATAMQPKAMTEQEVAAALKKKLEGKTLPKFGVVIPESHASRPIADPAAETEFNFLLRACDATVINTRDDGMGDWAKSLFTEADKPMPKGLEGADVAIVGEGFSEYAATTEKLISCKARLEVKAVDVKSGKILAVGRATATAVDLAENIAAKSALQKAAGDIAIKLIPDAVDAWAKNVKAAEKTGK